MCHSSFGGSARIGTELSIELANRGHRVHLFTLSTPFGHWDPQNGVILHPIIKGQKNDLHPAVLYIHWTDEELALFLSSVLKVIHEEGLDLIHFHYALPFAFIAGEVKKRLKFASPLMVGTLHGTDVSVHGQDLMMGPPLVKTLQEMDALTTVSLSHARLVKETFRLLKPPVVIPNFVNLSRFYPRNHDRPFWQKRRVRIVHVSNFRPVKNPEYILRIFAKIRERTKAQLWLIGDGPEMGKVESILNQEEIEKEVFFWGLQRDVAPLLGKADLLLISSQYESFCLSALEAMASGVPVLAPEVGGLPEVVIHGKTGYLYPLSDCDKAVDLTLKLLSNPDQYQTMREEAVSWSQHFSHTQIVSIYEALYKKLLDHSF